MWNLAITAAVAFVAGWLAHWVRARARMKALERECVRKLESADEQLALERVQLEWRFQRAMQNGGPVAMPKAPRAFDAYRDTHLARPRSAAPDSPASRA